MPTDSTPIAKVSEAPTNPGAGPRQKRFDVADLYRGPASTGEAGADLANGAPGAGLAMGAPGAGLAMGAPGAEGPAHRGQGLFVARTYLAKMGGSIVARNEADGVCFEITLARAA